ncbi:MAG TPA: hypothetical protein VGO52_10905 [Hyphomonadaceae bacterium]|jgi:TPP-dependent pyruvate/acetoin dehydrogenase alpha subunit|nr:hypothetical protein [Hyphomonadaceae bacterium]
MPDRATFMTPVRLRVSRRDPRDREYWIDRLKSAGANIVSEGLTGIDVEMTPDMIREVLDIDVDASGPDLKIVQQTRIKSHAGADPPSAYIPRKPQLF